MYNIWHAMRQRCENPDHPYYACYGGRGIYVSKEWADVEAFKRDMGPRPSASHSLDRIDNEGPYSPSNCRWGTKSEQTDNRRMTRWLTFETECMPMAKWARRAGISPSTLAYRLKRGWALERALTTPAIPKELRRWDKEGRHNVPL